METPKLQKIQNSVKNPSGLASLRVYSPSLYALLYNIFAQLCTLGAV